MVRDLLTCRDCNPGAAEIHLDCPRSFNILTRTNQKRGVGEGEKRVLNKDLHHLIL